MGICCVNNNVIEPQSIVDVPNLKKITIQSNKSNNKEKEKVKKNFSEKEINENKTIEINKVNITVNDNNNFWSYGTISSVWTTWQAGVNSTPAFQAQTYTYTFRDTRRTCFVELNGYTINSQLIIIDSNAYRSVEFYAGSAV